MHESLNTTETEFLDSEPDTTNLLTTEILDSGFSFFLVDFRLFPLIEKGFAKRQLLADS